MAETFLIIIFAMAMLGQIISEILGDTQHFDEEDTK